MQTKVKLLLVLGTALALAGCSKLTKENYAKLQIGQKRAYVEDILGKPDHCEDIVVADLCTWGNENKYIKVGFTKNTIVSLASDDLGENLIDIDFNF